MTWTDPNQSLDTSISWAIYATYSSLWSFFAYRQFGETQNSSTKIHFSNRHSKSLRYTLTNWDPALHSNWGLLFSTRLYSKVSPHKYLEPSLLKTRRHRREATGSIFLYLVTFSRLIEHFQMAPVAAANNSLFSTLNDNDTRGSRPPYFRTSSRVSSSSAHWKQTYEHIMLRPILHLWNW